MRGATAAGNLRVDDAVNPELGFESIEIKRIDYKQLGQPNKSACHFDKFDSLGERNLAA